MLNITPVVEKIDYVHAASGAKFVLRPLSQAEVDEIQQQCADESGRLKMNVYSGLCAERGIVSWVGVGDKGVPWDSDEKVKDGDKMVSFKFLFGKAMYAIMMPPMIKLMTDQANYISQEVEAAKND